MHCVSGLSKFLFTYYFSRFFFCNCTVVVLWLAAIVFSTEKTVQAQIVEWTNTTGTSQPWYDVGSNWAGGAAPDSTETASFAQAGTYEVWWDRLTELATPDVKILNVLAGDVTFLNNAVGVQHEFIILGSGSVGSFSDFSITGSSTMLTNQGLYLRSLGGAEVTDGGTFKLDSFHDQGATLSIEGSTGFQIDGNLSVESGSVVSNTFGYIGLETGSMGVATVTGTDSKWNNSSGLFLGGTDSIDGGVGTLNLVDSGQVNVGNDLFTGTVFNGSLTVSDTGSNGNLLVRNGSMISSTGTGTIAFTSSSTGVAKVTGNGSQWNSLRELRVGRAGHGTLIVEAGGVVSNSSGTIGDRSGSTGVATVTGSGSQWNCGGIGGIVGNLRVGFLGNGTLNVEAGGVVNNSLGSIGVFAGSTGVATVTGSGSQWNNSSDLWVGDYGHGTLNVEAGGLVTSSKGYISNRSGSTGVATVTGSGSQWNNSDRLYVGYSNHGTLNVEAGGVVNSMLGYIGSEPGTTGVVTVTGSGSQWNNSRSLFVGGDISGAGGTGDLTIQASGLVSVNQWLRILGPGTVNLDGGTISAPFFFHTEGGMFNFVDGRLHVGEFRGTLSQEGGTLAPDISPGTTTITEDYNLNAGTIESKFGGAGNPIDLVVVAGDANISLVGTSLELLPIGDMAAGTYTLLQTTGGTLNGVFENVTDLGIYDDLVGVQYTPTSVTLTLDFDLLAGDFDLDGDVDGADFLKWQRGESFTSFSTNDLADWETNYGMTASLFTAGSTVPEPSAWLLGALASIGILAVRLRKESYWLSSPYDSFHFSEKADNAIVKRC